MLQETPTSTLCVDVGEVALAWGRKGFPWKWQTFVIHRVTENGMETTSIFENDCLKSKTVRDLSSRKK